MNNVLSSSILTLSELKRLPLKLSQYPYVVVDAEWARMFRFLSKQFTFCDKYLVPHLTIVLWNKDFPLPTKYPDVGHPVLVVPCETVKNTIFNLGELGKKLTVLMYYSPKDVQGTVGEETWRDLLVKKDSPINKKRNLTGKFKLSGTEFKLKDCIGMFTSSLEDALVSVGVVNPYKGRPGEFGFGKAFMDDFMKACPDEFLEYAVGDTVFLGQAVVEKVKQLNTIIKDALGEGVIEYTIETVPMSSGSLVAKTFEAWLIHDYPQLAKAVMFLTDANSNKEWIELQKTKCDLLLLADDDRLGLTKMNKKFRDGRYVHGMAMGSIRNFPLLSKYTGLNGAVVKGGRCINEEPHDNPFDNRVFNVGDIDMSSCYGTSLRTFDYPFGIPTIIEYGRDEKPLKLGQLLKKYRHEMVDNLYTIYVSGSLNSPQDLFHSKYELNTAKIQRTILSESWNETEDVFGHETTMAHVGGQFLLTKKQLELSIITSDLLEALEKTASNQHYKEFMELDVDCMIYYPKSLERTIPKWCEEIKKGGFLGKNSKGDDRSRAWCRLPLEYFIGKFIDYRGKVKKQIVTKGDYFDLLQTGVKLFINTTYGDFAAPYFPMGNTVLANNITAKARLGVWMISKSLLTKQSITDGGMHSFDEVVRLVGDKKPALDTLADRSKFLAHRSVKVGKLTEVDVYELFKNNPTTEDEKWLDKLALDHINEFWANYGMKLPFGVEYKYSNTCKEAVYFGSADYLFLNTVKGKDIIKVRGAKQDDHPKKLFLYHLANPLKNPLPPQYYQFEELIGVSDYQDNPTRFGDALPGEEVTVETWHRPYTNGEIYNTYKEWKAVQDAKSKAIRRDEKEPNPKFGLRGAKPPKK